MAPRLGFRMLARRVASPVVHERSHDDPHAGSQTHRASPSPRDS